VKRGIVRKSNPTFRWHLSETEKKEIARLTRAGIRQSEIARIMHLGAPTVSKAQREMGLPTRVPIPEEKIMELFRRGWGGVRIAKHLKIAVSAVYKVAHKNKFRRADNVGYPTPPENLARFIEALKRREDYAKRLAKKYKVGLVKANRLAHEILACPEFRPGLSKPALSSNFPQKHYDPKIGPDYAVELVQSVCEKCFDGELPAVDDAAFVDTMMSVFTQTTLRGQPQPILECFANGLRQAVTVLRESQSSGYVN
jgi:DNA-binding CsgD family transcriptional regulator